MMVCNRVLTTTLLIGWASGASLAATPLADTYAVRTPADVIALIAYTTVIEPGDGQNTVTVLQQPAHGALSYPTIYTGSGQNFSYAPDSGYVGLDDFLYRVTDQDGDVSFGLISINVGNVMALVGDDDLILPAETQTALDILFNDLGFADPVTFEILQQPAHGELLVTVAGLPWQSHILVEYTPEPGFSGEDLFQYFLSDGTDQGTGTVVLTISPDTDGDGWLDLFDNCVLVANASQYDADGDGYGNPCDADLNNSGVVTATDFGLLRSVLNQPAGFSPLAAASDLNDSGLVTVLDFNILRGLLNKPPGPSGLAP